jgi:capsular exopolysaccharide synthesis family protein
VELRRYVSVLTRRRRLVAIVFVATVAAALIATLARPPRWTATATVRVQPETSLVTGTVGQDDISYLDRLMNTYSETATRPAIRSRVARDLRLDEPPEVAVTLPANTNLIDLDVTTDEAANAAPAANRVASLLVMEIRALARDSLKAAEASFRQRTRRLESEIVRLGARLEAASLSGSSEEVIRLREQISGRRQSVTEQAEAHERNVSLLQARANTASLATPAARPTEPANRNLKLALALGLLLGSVGAAGLAFLVEGASGRLRTGDEIEAAVDAPMLAAVPTFDRFRHGSRFDVGPAAEEAIRRLRTALLLLPDGNVRSLIVTSAAPGDGKSTIVANLGRSLAQPGRKVILVDADLRAPSLHTFFGDGDTGVGDGNRQGLSELLLSTPAHKPPEWQEYCRETGVDGLHLIPAGRPVEDPSTLLGSIHTVKLLRELTGRFDWVIVDSPAVLAVPDALTIAPSVDAALLIAGPNTHRESLRLTHQDLTRMGAPVLGVVVNGADDPELSPYLDYADYGARSAGDHVPREAATDSAVDGGMSSPGAGKQTRPDNV